MTKEKLHYYKAPIMPNLPGNLQSYNHTTGLCGLKEKYPLNYYIGYMTEAEAVEVLAGSKSGLRKMSSVNQFRGSR